MKTSFERILILLAASNLDEREFASFFRKLREMDSREFVSRIHEIRFLLQDLRGIGGEDRSITNSSGTFTSQVGDKVANLLQGEAGLPARLAVDALSRELENRGYLLHLEFDPKRGLRSWIEKLARDVPEGEILFVATTIRNRYVHDSPSDWRLK